MPSLSLLSCADVQAHLAAYLKTCRKAEKLSREALAKRSSVPAATIKRFETHQQISLRQFLLLWQSLDDIKRLDALTQPKDTKHRQPTSIDEVLSP